MWCLFDVETLELIEYNVVVLTLVTAVEIVGLWVATAVSVGGGVEKEFTPGIQTVCGAGIKWLVQIVGGGVGSK